jgi:hypothetical protein
VLRLFAFFLGVILLIINSIGLTTGIRSSELANETATYFPNDLSLTETDFYDQLALLDPNDRPAYLVALTSLVSQGVLHYWQPEGMDNYNIRLPWTENYLLRALSYVDPKFFQMYEFQDYRRALARGIGLCSQHAIITAGILQEQGIPAKLIELHGHVVLTAEVDEGQWWVLDPDYGLVIPMSLDAAEEHYDEVAQLYAQAGFSDYDVDKVEEWFATRDNVIYDGGASTYMPAIWVIEHLSYLIKWLFPLLLILPLLRVSRLDALRWQLRRLHVVSRRRLRLGSL